MTKIFRTVSECLILVWGSSFELHPSFHYSFSLRRMREITPPLTLNLINSIIFQYNLVEVVQEVAWETILDPSIIDPLVLAQGIVLTIAKELPQYKDIDILKILEVN